MASFIPAPGCAVVEVLGNQAGQPCEWTCAAQHGTSYTLANLVTLAGIFDGWYNVNMLPILPSAVTYEGITVRGLSSQDDLRYDLSEPLPGEDAAGALPAQVAVCVTKRTGFTGRSQRGRLYVWGIPDDDLLDERHINSALVTAYQDAFDALLAAMSGSGWGLGVLSYQHNLLPRTTAQFLLIDHFQVRDNRLDTQRHRLGAG